MLPQKELAMHKRKRRHTPRPWSIKPFFRAWLLYARWQGKKAGETVTDNRGRLYRVGPAGNLIRAEARRG
jgi:hypothetical protein